MFLDSVPVDLRFRTVVFDRCIYVEVQYMGATVKSKVATRIEMHIGTSYTTTARGGFGELKRSSPHAGNRTRSVPGVIESD